MSYLMTGTNARWSVCWVAVKKGKRFVVEKDFETDLSAAIDLYTRAKKAGKPMVTLRCANVGFPPPEKYQPYEKWMAKKERRNGRVRKFRVKVYVDPMEEVNLRGIWWCPYCREMRRFLQQDGFRFEGMSVPVEGVHCPICGVSHRDVHVRKYNPQARLIEFRIPKRIRRSSGSSRRRSRKRT